MAAFHPCPYNPRTQRQAVLACITLIVLFQRVYGYNLDTEAPIPANGPENTNFGFSVALHREGTDDMMIVGAPLEDIGIEGVSRSGAVYRCAIQAPYDSEAECTEIELDTEAGENQNISNQWLGATVKSSGGDPSVVMSCAPYYRVHYINSGKLEGVAPTGKCFLTTNNFSISVERVPVLCKPYKIPPKYRGIDQGFTCQAGMAGDFNEEAGFILGGPGSYGHQGSVFVQRDRLAEDEIRTEQRDIVFDNSLQGYSVAHGRFSGSNDVNYVAGAPRANGLKGLVLIYNSVLDKATARRIEGEITGSYFGHGVVAADFNADGLDDLVVSAPYYWIREQNVPDVGQITVFYQNAQTFPAAITHLPVGQIEQKMNISHQLPHDTATVITGKVVYGRFGFAITSLSDVNDDGINDLAVSAPYDDKGAVFIYHGRRNGKINTVETQILRPESLGGFGSKFNHFGYALSGGRDADENEYPDLLVGDYTADKVLLVRTRPIIRPRFDLTIAGDGVDINLQNIEINNQNFSGFCVTACMWYEGKGTPENYNFTVDVNIEGEKQNPRAMFHYGGTKRRSVHFEGVTIIKEVRGWCETLMALMEEKIADKISPVFVKLLATPILDEDLPVGSLHPVVDENSRTSQAQTRIKADCITNACTTDLVLNVNSDTSVLHMGDTSTVTLTATVANNADEAFQAMLHTSVPDSWKLAAYHPIQTVLVIICKQSEVLSGGVQCDIGNPLPRKPSKIKFNMTFHVFNVPGHVSSLTVSLHANSTTSEGENTTMDNIRNINISLEPKISVLLNGSTNLGQLVYNETVIDEEDILYDYEVGKEIIHTYWVTNRGPGTIGNATLEVDWPMFTSNGEHYLLYLTEVTLSTGESCEVSGEGINPEGLMIKSSDTTLNDTSHKRNSEQRRSLPDDTSSDSSEVENPPEPSAQSDMPESRVSNCSRGYEGCVKITCGLQNIPKGAEDVVLKIRSRLWLATLEKNNVFSWDMVSSASLEVQNLPYVLQPTEGLHEQAMLALSVIPEVIKEKQQAPTWAILLSILVGLLILLFTVLILWKLGFFKRKKFDRGEQQMTLQLVEVEEKELEEQELEKQELEKQE